VGLGAVWICATVKRRRGGLARGRLFVLTSRGAWEKETSIATLFEERHNLVELVNFWGNVGGGNLICYCSRDSQIGAGGKDSNTLRKGNEGPLGWHFWGEGPVDEELDHMWFSSLW